MSRKNRQRKPINRRRTAPRRKRPARSAAFWVVPGLLLLAGLLWWAWPRPAASLPEVDLSEADSTARRTIHKHVREVEARPGSGQAWGWLGAIYYAYGFQEAADTCLVEAQRLAPRDPRWPYFRSQLWTIDRPDLALEEAGRAASLAGTDPPNVVYRYARLLAESGQWDRARPLLERLVKAQPDFAPASLLLAQAALRESRIDQAMTLAQSCTNHPSTARPAWALLAQAHLRQGHREKAAAASARSSSLPKEVTPSDPYAVELSLRRDDPRDISLFCHTLLANRQLDAAQRYIDHLVEQYPNREETWLLEGRLRLLRHELGKAEQALRRCLELAPDSSQGMFQLGMTLLRQERLPEAAEVFAQAGRLKPDFGPAFFNRGLVLGRMGQLGESIAAFEECLRHNPEHIDAYFFLADLYLRSGNHALAAERIDQAASLDPDDPRLATFRQRLNQSATP